METNHQAFHDLHGHMTMVASCYQRGHAGSKTYYWTKLCPIKSTSLYLGCWLKHVYNGHTSVDAVDYQLTHNYLLHSHQNEKRFCKSS